MGQDPTGSFLCRAPGLQPRGPLGDPLVRRALNLPVDRSVLIENVVGRAARPLHGIVSPLPFGAGPAPLATDVAAARELLTRAGVGTGLTLAVDCPLSLPDDAAALTKELGRQLRAVGVSLDVIYQKGR